MTYRLRLATDELVPVHPDNVRKLREKSSTYKFEIRTPPRDGTKLLVLDIDVRTLLAVHVASSSTLCFPAVTFRRLRVLVCSTRSSTIGRQQKTRDS
eukprot:scaffold538_cov412-Prasinococcus_capsulatus_cf.AAC.10